jgi:hypothetical protein
LSEDRDFRLRLLRASWMLGGIILLAAGAGWCVSR